MFQPTTNDIRLITQKDQTRKIKIELLDFKTNVVIGELTGGITNDNFNISTGDNYRRTYSLDMIVSDSSFALSEDSQIWLDKMIKVYVGIIDIRTKSYVWYLQGTYAFSKTSYSYDESSKALSIDCVDLMAYLDGTLGGTIYGAIQTKIERFPSGLEYSGVKVDYTAINGITIYNKTYIYGGTVFTIQTPEYEPYKNAQGNTILRTIEDIVLKFDIQADNETDSPICKISYESSYDEEVNGTAFSKTYTLKELQDGIICKSLLTRDIKIEFLTSVNLYKITIRDVDFAPTEDLFIWWFSRPRSVVRADMLDCSGEVFCRDPNNLDNIATVVNIGSNYEGYISDSSTRVTYGSEDNPAKIDTGKITIDGTNAGETYLTDVFVSFLKLFGIKRYEINDIYETVPYDQEFSAGSTVYDVFSTLIGLYSNLEMYFDTDGVFVLKHVSTTNDEDPILNNDTIRPLVISESLSTELNVTNVSEIWGMSIDANIYAENDDADPNMVVYNSTNNAFEVRFKDLVLTDQNKIPDGTILAFRTPKDMIKHKSNIGLTVKNLNAITSNIKAVDKCFTVDEFSKSGNSYKINQNLQYTENIGGMVVIDVDSLVTKVEKPTGRGYGVGTEEGITETINNIEFKGIFYNMRSANAMVKVDDSGKKTLDLTKLCYCVQFKAIKDEAFRFYITHSATNIYVANSRGEIYTEPTYLTDINTEHKISYIDFVAPKDDTFYFFGYSTDSTTPMRLYGVSRLTCEVGKLPIYNYTTEELIPAGTFIANTTYTFKYSNNKLYYLGQWQIHAVAIEVLEVPDDEKHKEYVEQFNCPNIVYTQYDSRFAIENIGIRVKTCKDDVYSYIYTDDLALQRAEYENYLSVRFSSQLELNLINIPWLDVNRKITYKSELTDLATYMIESISGSNNSPTISVSATMFYPQYTTIKGSIGYMPIDTTNMTRDNNMSDRLMFYNNLNNLYLFDYMWYINKYPDLYNVYGYNPSHLFEHWCLYGIWEGRSPSLEYDKNYYSNNVKESDINKIIPELKKIFPEQTNETKLRNAALWYNFMKTGVTRNIRASNHFDVEVYKKSYNDLQRAFGDDYRAYFEHYVRWGRKEQRTQIK